MMSHTCPWCNAEVPLKREYADSDPTFIFFMNCRNCSTLRGEQGFWWEINQSDEYCGFVLQMKIKENGILKLYMNLKLDEYPNYTVESILHTDNGARVEVLLSEEKEITPAEAKVILLKVKNLMVFI